MPDYLKDMSLKAFTTFGIDVKAQELIAVDDVHLLRSVLTDLEQQQVPFLVLGGGSNMLFTGDFEGCVIKIENKGIEVVSENEDFVRVKAAAGENWHDFVMWCVNRGYGGIENLALIPGNVGSSPIQNIGAYGTEIKDAFESLEAIDVNDKQLFTLNKDACRFGYRDSIFKHELKGKSIIWNVTFRLSKHPVVHIEYGAIQEELRLMNCNQPGIVEVSEAICRIRRSKLPDPQLIGNAGSFFKNPTVEAEQAEYLKASYPGLVAYYLPDGRVKLAAGWLIEQCKWKGIRRKDAGVHEKQALVLVNYGNATGAEILKLAEDIQQSVLEKFDVLLEMEVNII